MLFTLIIDYSLRLFIKRLEFMDIVKAWKAYSTVDINDDSMIYIKELNY